MNAHALLSADRLPNGWRAVCGCGWSSAQHAMRAYALKAHAQHNAAKSGGSAPPPKPLKDLIAENYDLAKANKNLLRQLRELREMVIEWHIEEDRDDYTYTANDALHLHARHLLKETENGKS